MYERAKYLVKEFYALAAIGWAFSELGGAGDISEELVERIEKKAEEFLRRSMKDIAAEEYPAEYAR